MKNIIFASTGSWAASISRLILAIVIFPHGAQKLLGWFGGFGFEGTMKYFTETVGLPWIVGFLVIVLEFFGAIFLVLGIGTRIIAASYVMIASGIILTTPTGNHFFMNWFGNNPSEGYEYFLLWIALSLVLLIEGSGNYSIDRLIVNSVNTGAPRKIQELR